MNYLISLAKDIVKKRRLIGELAKADFKKRFVGSYFGIVWMFIQPIVTVAIYYFVFGVGFRSGDPIEGVPYVLWLVPGIVPWFFFSEALNTGTNCLQEYSYLVKKVVFRVEILPIIKMMSCLMVHLIFVLIMGALFLCFGWMPQIGWLQTMYYTLYYVVVGYRDSMIMGNGFWQRPGLTLYFWAVTLLLLLGGLKVFKRLRPHFSDVL